MEDGKHPLIKKAVLQGAWYILEEKYVEMLSILDNGTTLDGAALQVLREDRVARMEEQRLNQYGYRVDNGVAMLEIEGVMFPKANMITDISGGFSTQQFQSQFRHALGASDVDGIILAVDSPGGSATLIEETAMMVYAARSQKPVVAMVTGTMASAALFIATAASEVYSTSASNVIGSIGTRTTAIDTSKSDERVGIKRTILASPSTKALSGDAYNEDTMRLLDGMTAQFVKAVKLFRGLKTMGDEYGLVYLSNEAKDMGLIDGVNTRDQVFRRMGQLIRGRSNKMVEEKKQEAGTDVAAQRKPEVDVDAVAQEARMEERKRIEAIYTRAQKLDVTQEQLLSVMFRGDLSAGDAIMQLIDRQESNMQSRGDARRAAAQSAQDVSLDPVEQTAGKREHTISNASLESIMKERNVDRQAAAVILGMENKEYMSKLFRNVPREATV